MAIRIVPVTGVVSKVKKNNGDKNGKTWFKTSFEVAVPYTTKDGERRAEHHFFDAWEDMKLSEGSVYTVDGYMRMEKVKENFQYKLYATKAELVFTPNNGQSSETREETSKYEEDDIPF